MKRLMTRITSVVVTTVMVLSVAAGCDTDKSDEASMTNISSTTIKKGEQSVYPITKSNGEPLTLKVWQSSEVALKYYKQLNEVVAFQEMEKATGVHVEWMHPPIGQALESFNLMIASRNLPDVIGYPWGIDTFVLGGAQKYINDGIIIQLNDYLKNAPNLSKILSDNPDIKKRMTDDAGNLNYIALMIPDLVLRTYNGYMIRQDWLDKAGVPMPETTDELEAVLKEFQDKDVNGSGKKDEYLSATGTDKGIQPIDYFLWPFGATSLFKQDNGKVQYGAMQPEFRLGIAYLAKLYNQGLIDPEYSLNDETKLKEKFVLGNAAGAYGTAGRIATYTAGMSARNPDAKLVPIPSLKGPSGKGYWYEANTTNSVIPGIAIAITTANKYVAETMAWQDWVYTKAGEMAFNFGREGDTYVIENGIPKFTENITKDPKGRSQNEMIAITATAQTTWPTLGNLKASKLQKTEVEWNAYEVWSRNMPDNSGILPPLSFNEKELAIISAKMFAIEDYKKQMISKFIMGKEPIENWDKEFVPNLERLGVSDVINVYQSALDRFNER